MNMAALTRAQRLGRPAAATVGVGEAHLEDPACVLLGDVAPVREAAAQVEHRHQRARREGLLACGRHKPQAASG